MTSVTNLKDRFATRPALGRVRGVVDGIMTRRRCAADAILRGMSAEGTPREDVVWTPGSIPRSLRAFAALVLVASVVDAILLHGSVVSRVLYAAASLGLTVVVLIFLLRGSRGAWWFSVVILVLGAVLPSALLLTSHSWSAAATVRDGADAVYLILLVTPSARRHCRVGRTHSLV